MWKFLLLITTLLIPFIGISQEENEEEVIFWEEPEVEDTNHIYSVVEEMPEFKGGTNEMYKYLSKNLEYPEVALEAGIQGTVYIKFVVKKNGAIGDIVILRKVNKQLDEEAIRVIEAMPDWTPGKHRGRNVNTWYTIPIKYSIPSPIKKSKE